MTTPTIETPINLLVEGPIDEIVLRSVLSAAGLPCGTVYGKNGKADLLRKLPRYNLAAAHYGRWLAVVDLDHDCDCAPLFVTDTLPTPTNGMCYRVAVRAIEAWLLADAERLAKYLGISQALLPRFPDQDDYPKRTLVNLARRSRKRAIREGMAPRQGSGVQVGPEYLSCVQAFVSAGPTSWRPQVAQEHSDSLRRCLRSLEIWRAR
jgi:hypothetical protein